MKKTLLLVFIHGFKVRQMQCTTNGGEERDERTGLTVQYKKSRVMMARLEISQRTYERF